MFIRKYKEKLMRYVTYAKDGYIAVIDWIEAHPHWALLIGVGLVAGALFV